MRQEDITKESMAEEDLRISHVAEETVLVAFV
jgi:hypothetical protein